MGAEKFKAIAITVLAVMLSIYLGINAATEQSATVMKVVTVGVVLICLALGHRIWLLMMLMVGANVLLLRGFGTAEIGQALFLVFSALQFMVRKLRARPTFTELEFWALMVVLCIVQVYFRNPTGLNLFGASTVGGKPYIIMGLGIASMYVLSCLVVPAAEIRTGVRLFFLGSLLGIPGQLLRGGWQAIEADGAARIPSLARFGSIATQWLITRISPLRAVLHPFYGVLVLASVLGAAGSGYRSAVGSVLLLYVVAVYYWNGVRGMILAAFAGALGLTLLAFVNIASPLPGNVQRALSPLPGSWEDRYRNDGDVSTEWRMEMWKEAILTDRWIKNKWLGDGMGFKATDLRANMMAGQGRTSSGLTTQQEAMLYNGSYHSGPVHSVRCAGYFGLLVLVIAQFRMAVHAHRLLLRYRGTPWFSTLMFVCVPIIVYPIGFLFVFGEYPTAVTFLFASLAWLRLLERNLPDPRDIH